MQPKKYSASEIDLAAAYPEINGQHSGHRSPREAGAANKYYGQRACPNFSYKGQAFSEAEMTEEQKRMYYEGYESEDDSKPWTWRDLTRGDDDDN